MLDRDAAGRLCGLFAEISGGEGERLRHGYGAAVCFLSPCSLTFLFLKGYAGGLVHVRWIDCLCIAPLGWLRLSDDAGVSFTVWRLLSLMRLKHVERL